MVSFPCCTEIRFVHEFLANFEGFISITIKSKCVKDYLFICSITSSWSQAEMSLVIYSSHMRRLCWSCLRWIGTYRIAGQDRDGRPCYFWLISLTIWKMSYPRKMTTLLDIKRTSNFEGLLWGGVKSNWLID